RLGRSLEMVWRIMAAVCDQLGDPSISREAIWAIGSYLETRRQESGAVTVERQPGRTWALMQFSPHVSIRSAASARYRPCITFVLDIGQSAVISFRVVTDSDQAQNLALALYDALIAQRRPSINGAGGLRWSLPNTLLVKTALSDDCSSVCEQLSIQVNHLNSDSLLPNILSGNWTSDLAERILEQHIFELIFDQYLGQVFGFSPRANRRQRENEYAGWVGYNQDPAWHFPALRGLLPGCKG